MDLGSQYHLAWGEHRLAELFIKICMKNKAIFEQALQEVCQETVGHNWLSINTVVKLKRGKTALIHTIFKVNDKKWNGNPTSLMKSSRLATKTALQMDTHNKKTPHDRMPSLHGWITFESEDNIILTLWVENP